VKGILPDRNIEGHVRAIVRFIQKSEFAEAWTYLALPLLRFAEVGLADSAADSQVWRTCQLQQLILITANRNRRGSDSLEETIATLNQPTSLPVFTIADEDRLKNDRAYGERVATRLVEYLMDIDNYRGVGRIYLP
jgi:hypothetical protein